MTAREAKSRWHPRLCAWKVGWRTERRLTTQRGGVVSGATAARSGPPVGGSGTSARGSDRCKPLKQR
uniref:Uncharacterized protein n=1 Tax=Oryza glumipatula TaxID=40148 RepID=A0A0D9ZV80_9ORYZ